MFSVCAKLMPAHDYFIRACAWGVLRSTPEDVILTGGALGVLSVWKFDKNSKQQIKLLHRLVGLNHAIISLAVGEYDKAVCAASYTDQTIIGWDIEKATTLFKLTPEKFIMYTIKFTSCDENIATGSKSGKVYLHKIESGERHIVFNTQGNRSRCFAYSPNEYFLAVGTSNGTLIVFDVISTKKIYSRLCHTDQIRCVVFTPDSNYIVTGSDDNQMIIYDAVFGADEERFTTSHTGWVYSLSFAANGKYLVSASADRTIKIWDFPARHCIQTIKQHTQTVYGVQFSPDGSVFISVGEDGNLFIYETLKGGEEVIEADEVIDGVHEEVPQEMEYEVDPEMEQGDEGEPHYMMT